MANREEILKQTQRFRHTLDAMEHVIKTGNTEALEALIRSASEARAGWQMNAATPQHASLKASARTEAGPIVLTTKFIDIPPLSGVAGTVRVPGSKSISNRALLLAGFAAGTTVIDGVLDSDDTRVMIDALVQLGCGIEAAAAPAHRARPRRPAGADRARPASSATPAPRCGR